MTQIRVSASKLSLQSVLIKLSSSRIRGIAAGFALAATILLPILLTRYRSFGDYYYLIAGGTSVFCCLLLPETIAELLALWRSFLFRLNIWTSIILLVGWKLFSGPMWESPRTAFYLSLPFFYASLLAWFRNDRSRRMQQAVLIKMALTALAAGWIVIVGAIDSVNGQIADIIWHPPIYFHFRHVNPDIFTATTLAICLLWNGTRHGVFIWIALIPLGYFSLWSGGRAEFLGFAVFGGLLAFSRSINLGRLKTWKPLIPFVFGAVIVLIAGQTYFVEGLADRTITTSAQTLTSDRSEIWAQAIRRLLDHWNTALFGFGPDGYSRAGISLDMEEITGRVNPTNHPHNTLILWLVEFGLLGLLSLGAMMLKLILDAAKVFRGRPSFSLIRGVAAILISTFFFSLLDCQFFYPAPLMFFMILAAYFRTHPSSTADTHVANS